MTGFEQEQIINGARVRRMRRLFTHADLTNPSNGGSEDLDHAEPLAGLAGQVVRNRLLTDALILGVFVRLDQAFTGGGASAVSCTIGTIAQPNVVMQSFNLLGSAPGPTLDGNRGVWRVVSADSFIVVRFSIDAGHNLLALTTGAALLEVIYSAAPARA